MLNEPYCQLTAKDLSVLEVMLDRCNDRDGPLAALIQRKLDAAVVVFRDDIPPKVVTLNSRVAYRVDHGILKEHLIVQSVGTGFPDFALSIHTLRGLGLLGLAEGQSITIDAYDGKEETLFVESVIFQPEAGFRDRERRMMGPFQPTGGIPYSVGKVVSLRLKRPPVLAADPDDDDPGPQAA